MQGGGTENAGAQYAGLEMWELISGLENARPVLICRTKCRGRNIQHRKMKDWNMRDQMSGLKNTGPENAGLENEGPWLLFWQCC